MAGPECESGNAMGVDGGVMPMKKRTQQTRTGNRGVTAIMRYCDENGLIFQAEPREDYGIDCYIELEADAYPQNFIIGVQAKAGPSYKQSVTDASFSVYVSEEDIAYWLAANYPVFFVYYDTETDQLHFKHVQKELQHYADVSECKKFVFSEADSASGGALASYARNLLTRTPNLLNRLEITKAKYPILRIGEERVAIEPSLEGSGLVDITTYVSQALECPLRSFPHYTTVVGYSVDARWICTLDLEDLGPVGAAEIAVTFLDTLNWATLSVPLFDYLEWYRPEGKVRMKPDYGDLLDRANQIQQMIQRLGIFQARTIYRDAISDTRSCTNRPAFALAYGTETFNIDLTRYGGRDALVLTNHAYSPVRSVSLLSERLSPGRLFESETNGDLDLYIPEEVRRFDSIYEVTLSNDGGWVTISIITNSDHSCWGHPLVHLVHLRTDELRELCVRALAL